MNSPFCHYPDVVRKSLWPKQVRTYENQVQISQILGVETITMPIYLDYLLSWAKLLLQLMYIIIMKGCND